MALAVVQSKVGTPSGNTATPTAQFTSNTTTGNLIVVGILPGGSDVVNSVSDGTNTFVKFIQEPNATGIPVEIWYKENAVGLTTPTVTATLAGPDPGNVLILYEVSGAATSSSADGVGGGATGTGTTPSSGAYTTSNANDILFSFCNSFGALTAGTSGWTTETTFFSGQFKIVSSAGSNTATYTQSSSVGWTVAIAAFKAGSATTINATVAMAGHATFTPTAHVLKDATFFCSAGAAGTFTPHQGKFAQAIIQGRTTGTAFTATNTRLTVDRILGRATLTLTPKVTRNSTLAIAGSAGGSRFNAGSVPIPVNASVHIFAFAANNVVIDQFVGRATLTARAGLVTTLITINGRATLTLAPQVTHNVTDAIRGRATLTLTAISTGPQPNNATVVIRGHGAFTTLSAKNTHNAQIVIEAGNLTFVLVEAKILISSRAAATLQAKVTRNSTLSIAGTATLQPFGTIFNNPNIFGVVRVAGTATGRFATPVTIVNSTVRMSGRAMMTLLSTDIGSVNATAFIRGTAVPAFLATVQGATNLNAVVVVRGTSALTPLAFKLVQPSCPISALGSIFAISGGAIRGTANLAGFAFFRPQVAKSILQWSSGNTLQYKVWQYRTEDMVRVLGSSWTVNSVGLSFQSVAFEVTSTEAGWGS